MFASVVAWTFKPGSADEVRRRNLDMLIPEVTRAPGFRQYYAIRSGPDAYVTVIFYDDRERAEAALQHLTPLIREQQGHLLAGMERYAGEVEVAEPR
ncbi:MAG TPA: antibiotic biosynthesis monooxygenase [Thermomicrobiales bacterium]|nr:antibiotic biosynthesis monooxygenase [Thermomicrobiales bacterium]